MFDRNGGFSRGTGAATLGLAFVLACGLAVSVASGNANAASSPATDPPPPSSMPLPTAMAGASPTSGGVGTTVSFTSTGSAPGSSGSPIVSFDWDYGDGETDTGATVSHTYTAIGTYTVSLTVTDAAGLSGVSMVTITIADNATPGKAAFKLNFVKDNADSFSATFTSKDLVGLQDPKGSGKTIQGTVTIGDQPWLFTFDTSTGKSTNKDGPKVSLNDKTGTISVQLKATDVQDVLDEFGAVNDDVSKQSIDVPVALWLDGKSMYISTTITFIYSAKADKSGAGKN